MSVADQFRDGMRFRVNSLFQNTIFRYLFGIAAVASVFALTIWLIPLTGTGAPYVLFFAAVLVTSLSAGVGPAICAVLLSMPLGAYTFVAGAGYSSVQASFQSLLFAVDGIVVIYLTLLTKKWARSLHNASGQVHESEAKYRALFDSIDEGFCVVEVLFDDADNALDYRFLEINRAFEKQTGISNAVGRRMREIAPAHEVYWFQICGQIARFPSRKALSRLMGDTSGSRAPRGAGVLFSSRFPESLQRRTDGPMAVDLLVQPRTWRRFKVLAKALRRSSCRPAP
jgi:PAS domain-containing protein